MELKLCIDDSRVYAVFVNYERKSEAKIYRAALDKLKSSADVEFIKSYDAPYADFTEYRLNGDTVFIVLDSSDGAEARAETPETMLALKEILEA
jgi:hypothetical protein